MLEGLAAESGSDGMLMVNATHLKVHLTAAGLRLKEGIRTADRTDKGRSEFKAAHGADGLGRPLRMLLNLVQRDLQLDKTKHLTKSLP